MLTAAIYPSPNSALEKIMIPNKKWSFLGVAQDQYSLASLTLRQLRLKASDLGIPMYSRKTKAALMAEVLSFQSSQEKNTKTFKTPFLNKGSNSSKSTDQNISKSETRIVFLPRDPQWAYVFWEISEKDREKAIKKGASRLSLRLADVTGMVSGTFHRHTLQEIPVDSHVTEWYLPIPMSDREYRVEIGYRSSNQWISLAHSSTARVPSLYPSDQILDQFVPFSLEADNLSSEKVQSSVLSSSEDFNNDLHERLYKTATYHFKKTRIGSEELHERIGGQRGSNESGVGVWSSGHNESGVGALNSVHHPFWLVADSELVLYGSTDPSASVKIGGEDVPLSSEGTFRLQVPFRDGIQNYPIEAVDVEGQQKRNITMKFERSTPEDNTNPSNQKQSEWF